MNLLLDTHTFIWFINGDSSIPESLQKKISNTQNACYLSVASIWEMEMAIKISLNKLDLTVSFSQISQFLTANEIEVLPISFEGIQQLIQLPFHHRDPFDRLIIAQAIQNNLVIASKDVHFPKYSVKVIWE